MDEEGTTGAICIAIILGVVFIMIITSVIFETRYKLKQEPHLPVMCLDGVEYYSTKYNLTPHLRNENSNIIVVTCQEKR